MLKAIAVEHGSRCKQQVNACIQTGTDDEQLLESESDLSVNAREAEDERAVVVEADPR